MVRTYMANGDPFKIRGNPSHLAKQYVTMQVMLLSQASEWLVVRLMPVRDDQSHHPFLAGLDLFP